MKVRRGLWAAGLGLAAAFAAGPAGAQTPKPGGTLTYMISADAPPSFDGHRETTFATVHGDGGRVVRSADLRVDRFLGPGELEAAGRRAADERLPDPVAGVFLTGANGFLGRFLLLELLERLPPDTGRVHALVRAPDNAAPKSMQRSPVTDQPATPIIASVFRKAAMSPRAR